LSGVEHRKRETEMHDEGTNSHLKIFANIFISFIGAGILGLPYAFKEVCDCGYQHTIHKGVAAPKNAIE